MTVKLSIRDKNIDPRIANVGKNTEQRIIDIDNIQSGTNTDSLKTNAENVHQMASNWDKFRLLMWKNALLQWRHKIRTIIEILVPVAFCMMLIYISSIVSQKHYLESMRYQPFEINTLISLK